MPVMRTNFPSLARDGYAQAVGVGVGGHHAVGLELGPQLEGELKCRGLLGVGEGHGGEFPVGLPLLGDGGHVEAQVPHHPLKVEGPGAVQGGVDELDALPKLLEELGPEELGLDHGDIGLVHFLVDDCEESLGQGPPPWRSS